MSKIVKRIPLFVAGAVFAVAVLATPPVAEAGLRYGTAAGCDADKYTLAGSCWGTIRGFRHSSNPTTYASFNTSFHDDGTVARSFGASFNGRAYGCTVAPGFIDPAVWSLLQSNPDIYFNIRWGALAGDSSCRMDDLRLDSAHLD